MPNTGNWVMATAGVWNLSSPACLCQGCLPWWLRPCSKIRKLHRSSQSGLLRGLRLRLPGGELYTPHLPPAQKALPQCVTAPFSQSSRTTSGTGAGSRVLGLWELSVKFSSTVRATWLHTGSHNGSIHTQHSKSVPFPPLSPATSC